MKMVISRWWIPQPSLPKQEPRPTTQHLAEPQNFMPDEIWTEKLKISGGWLRQSWWVWREREKRNENETVAMNICIKVLVCVVIVFISLDKYLGVKLWRNANQNHNKVSPHTSQKSYHQNSTNNKCWTGCGKRESYYTVGGNVNWYSHYGEQNGGGVV